MEQRGKFILGYLIIIVSVTSAQIITGLIHPPTNLKVEPLSFSALQVSWCLSIEDVKEQSFRCGKTTAPFPIDLSYEVRYKHGEDYYNSSLINGSSTKIQDLLADTEYVIDVIAIGFNTSSSIYSESVSVSTLQKVNSVSSIQVWERENATLFVSWKWSPSSGMTGVTFDVTLNANQTNRAECCNFTFSNYDNNFFNVCVTAIQDLSSSDEMCQDELVPNSKDKNLGLALGLGLGIPLALIVLVVGAYFGRKYVKSPSRSTSSGKNSTLPDEHKGGGHTNLGIVYGEELRTAVQNRQGTDTIELPEIPVQPPHPGDSRYIDEKQEKLLKDEFARMFKNPKPSGHSTAISSQFKSLNRFTNIEPYDHTLVKVSNVQYINASYIMNRKFIATQDPWPTQDDDLWQMIWECNVRVIIRLSNESAGHPTAHYIRDEIGGNWVMGHDELTVSVKDIQTNSCFQKKIVTVTKDAHSRVIEHYHMTNWSEGSVPSADDLYQLVSAARNSRNKYDDGSNGPTSVLIHCSAGIGRTGTVIALWCMMDEYEDKFFSNIVKTVQRLREDRMGMVQTEEQYVRVYECFMLFQDKSTIIRGDDYEYAS